MSSLKHFLRFTTASVVGLTLSCSVTFAADKEQVTVFAAASLTNALDRKSVV